MKRKSDTKLMREAFVQDALKKWLEQRGYRVRVAEENQRGIDIRTSQHENGTYYFIECKGEVRGDGSSLDFRTALGQILMQMHHGRQDWKWYGISIPDTPRFRRQYCQFMNVPLTLRKQLKLRFFFVDEGGRVKEEKSWRGQS